MAQNLWANLAVQMSRLYWDSSYVFACRTRDMANGRITADEWNRMVSEKPVAFLSAVQSGSGAIMKGGHPAHVAHSAIKPIGRRADQNARRLRGRQ